MFNAHVLDDAGCRVIEAANADEALVLFDARPDIRVVITDVDMPGSMNGFELARVAVEKRPFVGPLIVSGRVRPKREDLPDDARFLAKPYTAGDLLQIVEGVLAVSGQKRPTSDGGEA